MNDFPIGTVFCYVRNPRIMFGQSLLNIFCLSGIMKTFGTFNKVNVKHSIKKAEGFSIFG